MLGSRRSCSSLRDVAIYILCQLGVYRNIDIGRIFGVGYTAVTEAAKRGRTYLNSDKSMAKNAKEFLIDY